MYISHISKESYVPWSKVAILGMVIPPFNGNPYNGYINPYYWVDDHPQLYGNNGSLIDPGTYVHGFSKRLIKIFNAAHSEVDTLCLVCICASHVPQLRLRENEIGTMWVSPKIGGKLPKWMVKIMENPH